MDSTKIKLLQLNTRSISNKKDLVEFILERDRIDIAILCETWLKDDFLKFKNFEIIKQNRIDGYGGVAILVRKLLKLDLITQRAYDPIETVEVKVHIKTQFIKLFHCTLSHKLKRES